MQVIDRPDVDQDVHDIAQAWSALVRRSMVPKTQVRWARLAGVHLDRASYWVLRALHDGGTMRLSEMAQRQGTDISTVCRQVKPCEEAGLVRREGDPSDLRAVLFTLTEEGRQALERMTAVRLAVFDRALAGWTARERREFARMSERFVGAYLDELEKLG